MTGHFASHAADAWRYLALAWREPVPPDEELDPIAELLKPKTLNDWWQQHVDEQIELGADPEAFGEDLTFI